MFKSITYIYILFIYIYILYLYMYIKFAFTLGEWQLVDAAQTSRITVCLFHDWMVCPWRAWESEHAIPSIMLCLTLHCRGLVWAPTGLDDRCTVYSQKLGTPKQSNICWNMLVYQRSVITGLPGTRVTGFLQGLPSPLINDITFTAAISACDLPCESETFEVKPLELLERYGATPKYSKKPSKDRKVEYPTLC